MVRISSATSLVHGLARDGAGRIGGHSALGETGSVPGAQPQAPRCEPLPDPHDHRRSPGARRATPEAPKPAGTSSPHLRFAQRHRHAQNCLLLRGITRPPIRMATSRHPGKAPVACSTVADTNPWGATSHANPPCSAWRDSIKDPLDAGRGAAPGSPRHLGAPLTTPELGRAEPVRASRTSCGCSSPASHNLSALERISSGGPSSRILPRDITTKQSACSAQKSRS